MDKDAIYRFLKKEFITPDDTLQLIKLMVNFWSAETLQKFCDYAREEVGIDEPEDE